MLKNTEICNKGKTQFISHRGFSFKLPENTLEAFRMSSELGYKYAECDISETIDGNFVLLHDETIDRVTNSTGNITKMKIEDVSKCDINLLENYYHKDISKTIKIPTIKEFLLECIKYNIHPIIEIKRVLNDESLKRLIDEINTYILDYTIISFNLDFCKKIKKINNEIEVYQLTDFFPTIEDLDKLKKDNLYISVHHSTIDINNLGWFEYAKSIGIRISCYTVNDYARAKQLMDINIDFITTDLLIDHHNEKFLAKCIGINPITISPIKVEIKKINPIKQSIFLVNELISNSENDMLSIHLFRIAGCDCIKLNCEKEFENKFDTKIIYFDSEGFLLDDVGFIPSGIEQKIKVAVYCMISSQKRDKTKITKEDIKSFEKIKITLYKENGRIISK